MANDLMTPEVEKQREAAQAAIRQMYGKEIEASQKAKAELTGKPLPEPYITIETRSGGAAQVPYSMWTPLMQASYEESGGSQVLVGTRYTGGALSEPEAIRPQPVERNLAPTIDVIGDASKVFLPAMPTRSTVEVAQSKFVIGGFYERIRREQTPAGESTLYGYYPPATVLVPTRPAREGEEIITVQPQPTFYGGLTKLSKDINTGFGEFTQALGIEPSPRPKTEFKEGSTTLWYTENRQVQLGGTRTSGETFTVTETKPIEIFMAQEQTKGFAAGFIGSPLGLILTPILITRFAIRPFETAAGTYSSFKQSFEQAPEYSHGLMTGSFVGSTVLGAGLGYVKAWATDYFTPDIRPLESTKVTGQIAALEDYGKGKAGGYLTIKGKDVLGVVTLKSGHEGTVGTGYSIGAFVSKKGDIATVLSFDYSALRSAGVDIGSLSNVIVWDKNGLTATYVSPFGTSKVVGDIIFKDFSKGGQEFVYTKADIFSKAFGLSTDIKMTEGTITVETISRPIMTGGGGRATAPVPSIDLGISLGDFSPFDVAEQAARPEFTPLVALSPLQMKMTEESGALPSFKTDIIEAQFAGVTPSQLSLQVQSTAQRQALNIGQVQMTVQDMAQITAQETAQMTAQSLAQATSQMQMTGQMQMQLTVQSLAQATTQEMGLNQLTLNMPFTFGFFNQRETVPDIDISALDFDLREPSDINLSFEPLADLLSLTGTEAAILGRGTHPRVTPSIRATWRETAGLYVPTEEMVKGLDIRPAGLDFNLSLGRLKKIKGWF